MKKQEEENKIRTQDKIKRKKHKMYGIFIVSPAHHLCDLHPPD